MIRHFALAVVFLACAGIYGCRNQTSGLIQSAARGDEAVTFSNLRSIMLAQQAYNLSTGSYGTFQQLTEGGYLNAKFAEEKPVVSEYAYTMTVTEKTPDAPMTSYSCNADPTRTGDRGGRHLYIDSNSHDIHANATQPATAADEIIKP